MIRTLLLLRASGRNLSEEILLGCYGREKAEREIAPRAQASGSGEDGRNCVDDNCGGGNVAVRAAGNDERKIRLTLQLYRVGRLLCADEHFQLHENVLFARGGSASDLMHSGNLAARNHQEFGGHFFFCDYRINRL